MLPHIRIPSHITALYVFAVVNLMALFHITLVEANIVVLDPLNVTIVELSDLPAKFGPPFPDSGLWGHVSVANPRNACGEVEAPPGGNKSDVKWIAIIRRHGCDFDEKVFNAQVAGYAGALVHNVGSDDLIPMGAGTKGEKVDIPAAFIGEADGEYLSENFDKKLDYFIVIDNQVPFNPNMYLLPFAIVVGICFLLMLAFMVAKWVRDIRKRRRARLSLQHLKKLPTKKFKKGDNYDVCAICLDEYEEGEKLRILPCSHAYHMKCVDPWLTKNKRTCPVCKRKVIPGDDDDSDSDTDTDDDGDTVGESTPLLTATNGNQVHRVPREPSESHPDPAPDTSDSETDSLSGVGAAAPPSYQSHQSQADVHAPRIGSYGAIAAVTITNENPETSSLGSQSRGSDSGDLIGAVCGKEDSCDFVDDYYTPISDQEMTGLVSGDATEEDAEPVTTSLRVKIFGPRGKKSKKRRRDEEA